MNELAKRVVLGWTPEGLRKGAWEVFPWTWMINWFTGMGSYLLLNSNTVPAQHSSACLMNSVTVTAIPAAPTKSSNTETCTVRGTGSYRYTSKTRSVSGSVASGFQIPFVGIYRLSILGALFIQRFKR